MNKTEKKNQETEQIPHSFLEFAKAVEEQEYPQIYSLGEKAHVYFFIFLNTFLLEQAI